MEGSAAGRDSCRRGLRRVALIPFLATAAMAAFTPATLAAPGDLDPSFDSDGKLTTDFGTNEGVSAVAIQPDGKIVVAGYATLPTDYDFVVARYKTDGGLDASFDGDGIASTSFGVSASQQATGVAIQGDGKIVVGGWSSAPGTVDFALARFNTNGGLDTSFDGDGKVTTDFISGASCADRAAALAIQPDGKIVVAGSADCAGGNRDFALARYGTSGALDAGFDADGMLTTAFSTGDDSADDLGIQSDGKIVAAGSGQVFGQASDFAVARYAATGALDPSFDIDGRATVGITANSDTATGLAIQSDGKLLVAGTCCDSGSDADFAVARIWSSGIVDDTFGSHGRVTTSFTASSDRVASLAVQADGRLVVAGGAGNGLAFGLARYLGDSAPAGTSPPGTSPPDDETPPEDGSSPDAGTALGFTLGGATAQKALRHRGVVIRAKCVDAACTVTAKGTVSMRGSARSFRLRSVTRHLAQGANAHLKLRFLRRGLAAVRRALRRGRKVRATIAATATDAAGRSALGKREIRLKA